MKDEVAGSDLGGLLNPAVQFKHCTKAFGSSDESGEKG